jgi:hypothetical protein
MKTRRLTVSSTYFNDKQVPYIRLSGNWLVCVLSSKNVGFYHQEMPVVIIGFCRL